MVLPAAYEVPVKPLAISEKSLAAAAVLAEDLELMIVFTKDSFDSGVIFPFGLSRS